MIDFKLLDVVSINEKNKMNELFLVVGFQINFKGLDDQVALQDNNYQTIFVNPKRIISRKNKTIDDMFSPKGKI